MKHPCFTGSGAVSRPGGRGAAKWLAALALVALLGATREAPAAEPADGLYLRTLFAFGSLSMNALYFKDGQLALNPAGGIDKFDFAQAKKTRPGEVGTVQRKGDQLAVAWADGKTKSASFEKKEGGCFYWEGLACPVKAFGKGEKIDGTFSGGASVGGGAVSSSVTLVLSKDGRYKLSRGGVVVPGGNVAGAAGSFSDETGTYELSGNTLALKPASGPARLVLTFPYDDGTKGELPRRMYFDGGMLKRI